MKQFNKVLIITMILVLATMGFSSFATTDYITESFTVSKSEINNNDIFTLTLDLKNVTSANSADYLTIINTNFETTNGIRKITILDINSIPIDLKYVGSDNTFTFDIFQNDGTQTGSETINITQAREYSSSSSSSSSTDTTKYMPLLGIKSDYKISTFIGGQNAKLSIPVENTSKYSAKNIDVTIDLKDGPFTSKNNLTYKIDRIASNKIENVIFDLEISKLAINKTYIIPVTIQGWNSFGDKIDTINATYKVKIINSNIEPKVSVFDYEIRGNVTDGSEAIIIDLKNFGSMNATDVNITLEGFDKDGIRLYKDTQTKKVSNISGGKTKKVYFGITSDKSIKSGIYELTGKISYFDEEGNSYNVDSPIYLNLNGVNESDMNLSINDLKYNSEINTGNDLDISFNVENKGLVNFEKVEISLVYPNQMISKTPKKIILNDFKMNDIEKCDFKILVNEKTASDNYDFFIKVNGYLDKSDEVANYTFDNYFGVFVKGASEKGRPKLIVDNYFFDGDNVLAGKEFPLTLFIKNTSDVQTVKNIKVSIQSSENVFMPVNTSSSFFIDEILTNTTVEKTIILKTTPDANVKTYNLSIKMQYEDSEGNAYDSEGNLLSETDDLSISVLQPIRLETSDITMPFEFYIGTAANLEVEFYNMGRSAMSNMMIKTEGDFDIQNGSYFKGDFQPGGSDYFSTTIIPSKEGLSEGKIIFSFEDAVGNITEIEKEFEINAMAAQEFNEGDFNNNSEGFPDEFNQGQIEEKSKLPFIIIGILVGIIALTIILKNRKKRKLKKLMEFDDIDD